jgi:hypothetical protein
VAVGRTLPVSLPALEPTEYPPQTLHLQPVRRLQALEVEVLEELVAEREVAEGTRLLEALLPLQRGEEELVAETIATLKRTQEVMEMEETHRAQEVLVSHSK